MKPEELHAMPPLAAEFARHKKVVQGCSVKTVDEYLLDLRMFFKFIKLLKDGKSITDEAIAECCVSDMNVDDFKEITTTDIYEFLYYLDADRNSGNRNKARKLSAIKAFFKFLTTKKMLFDLNPAVNIETPKLKKQLPKHLTMEESISLLEAVLADGASRSRPRDFAILTLFLNCGMRLSELAGIDLNDIDTYLRSLRVMGKGSKERIVYLNEACRQALGDYLAVRQTMQLKRGENALFVSSRGTRISVKTIQHMTQKYLDAAGLGNKGFSVHKLRHTAATLMYQSGEVDIRTLKDILGHEQLNTTQIYTHVSDRSMESAMNKNPLSGVKLKKKPPVGNVESESSEENDY